MLADHALFELRLHPEQFLGLLFFHPLERNARDFGDDVHHVVASHDDLFLFAFFAPLGQNSIELFLGLLLLVAERSGFFKILGLDRSFFF